MSSGKVARRGFLKGFGAAVCDPYRSKSDALKGLVENGHSANTITPIGEIATHMFRHTMRSPWQM